MPAITVDDLLVLPRIPISHSHSSRSKGAATISEDHAETVATKTRIGERYLGADSADEFGRSPGVTGKIMVRTARRR